MHEIQTEAINIRSSRPKLKIDPSKIKEQINEQMIDDLVRKI